MLEKGLFVCPADLWNHLAEESKTKAEQLFKVESITLVQATCYEVSINLFEGGNNIKFGLYPFKRDRMSDEEMEILLELIEYIDFHQNLQW
jgi:hypothetical protein